VIVPRRIVPGLTASLSVLVLAMLVSGLTAASAAAGSGGRIRAAGKSARQADHVFVQRARELTRCERVHARNRAICRTRRQSLQQAGRRLAARQRTLARLVEKARVASRSASRRAPVIRVSGPTLSWSKVAGVKGYVLARRVPGQADQYSVIATTSVAPPAVPGARVRYSVRTAVSGSAWSRERSIVYPHPLDAGRQAAPVMTASGQGLTWNRVSDVNDYVLLTRVPGQADQYSAVSGTSATPAPVPGRTVTYSLRTAVDGSGWSLDTTVRYPGSAPTPASSPAPDPSSSPREPSSGSFHAGVVAGSALDWELSFIKQLGARDARMEFAIGTPASEIEPYVDAYAKAGIQPLLLATFNGRAPTVAEARNLGTWAADFGPNGAFWEGKSYPSGTAVQNIEFGNESSQSYQYPSISGDPNWAKTPFYLDIAKHYALRFADAQTAIQAANPSVGLLAVGDTPGNWSTWMDSMFQAVPDLGNRVAGWTVHPYGPSGRWERDIDGTIELAKSHGAPDAIPLYVTEYGVASDDGRCLSDNYGWDPCMTYDAAGSALTQAIAGMRSRYGSRLRAVYVYQAHDQKTTGTTTDREGYFGSLTLTGGSKGGYSTAIESLLALNP
jgi:hypothetical protein